MHQLDIRGFSPSEEIYTSLNIRWRSKVYLKNEIKIAIEALYNGTKYGVIANMEDEIVVQRDVLKYIQYNYPEVYSSILNKKIYNLLLNNVEFLHQFNQN